MIIYFNGYRYSLNYIRRLDDKEREEICNIVSKNNYTLLHKYIQQTNVVNKEVLQLLITNKNIDICSKIKNITPLVIYILKQYNNERLCNMEIIKLLLSNQNKLVLSNTGFSPLHYYIQYDNIDIEIFDLLNDETLLNQTNILLDTPLHTYCKSKNININIIDGLLINNINSRNAKNLTPLKIYKKYHINNLNDVIVEKLL